MPAPWWICATSSTATPVSFTSVHEDIDATPLMKGLPDDRCQCPHWGYVFKGKMTARYADRDEVFEAGDAFYTPPGHVPVKNEPDTEIVVQPQPRFAHGRGGHDEEHAGDAGRLNALGGEARGELRLPHRLLTAAPMAPSGA
jgi:hypothetical protein